MKGFPTFKGSWHWPWPWIGSYCIPLCITHRPLSTRQISLKSKKLLVDGRTYGHLRPTLLGRLRKVDLKCRADAVDSVRTRRLRRCFGTYLFRFIISTVWSRRRRKNSREISFSLHPLLVVDLRLYSGQVRIPLQFIPIAHIQPTERVTSPTKPEVHNSCRAIYAKSSTTRWMRFTRRHSMTVIRWHFLCDVYIFVYISLVMYGMRSVMLQINEYDDMMM